MDILSLFTVLTILSALFGYFNLRFLRLPGTIGLLVIAVLFTLGILAAGYFVPEIATRAESFVRGIDFEHLLMDGMLSFLLFAGALHTDFEALKQYRWPIITFATVGVLISTLIVGSLLFLVSTGLGFSISYIYCLLFGALISPTDPIAVLGILKKAGAPKPLEIKIVGESLFNDGIGVVVFLTLYSIARTGLGEITALEVAELFAVEVIGGIALGLALGWIAWQMMRRIDDYATEVMITLSVVMGGYWLASHWHVSGPLAMVVAGLFIGNETVRASAMSATTSLYVDKFWELVDVFLNAVLFVLIGLEIILMDWEPKILLLGVLSIPVVLMARFVSLEIPIRFMQRKLNFLPRTSWIMTWGGLRGGISIALALSLSAEMPRELFLNITYIIVLFSIVVQGLTVEKVVGLVGVGRKR